jgi:Tfp pilus assembly protein PilP
MALNEQIYQQRINELKQDEAQQRQAARQERFQQQQQPAATQQQVPQQTSPTQTVEIRLPNGGTSSLSGDPDSVNQLLEFLNEAGMRATQ